MITEIELVDFKGRTGRTKVGTVSIFVGPNDAGKSALLEAVRFAVTGTTSLGKTLAATALLGSPRGCSVAVTLDDGFKWSRTLVQHHRTHKLSTSLSVTGEEGDSVTKLGPVVTNRVGDFAPMFDIARIARSSPEVLRNLVMSLAGEAMGTTSDGIAEQIIVEFCRIGLREGFDAIVGQDDVADALPALQQALDPDVLASLVALVETLRPSLEADDITEAIGGALKKANGAVQQHETMAKSKAIVSEESSARLAELKVVAESAITLQATLDTKRTAEKAALLKVGEAEARRAWIKVLADGIGHIDRRSTELQQRLTGADVPDEAATDAKIDAMLVEASKLEAGAEPAVDSQYGERFKETEEAERVAQRACDEAFTAETRAQAELAIAETRHNGLKASPLIRGRECAGKLHPVIMPVLSENPAALGWWDTLTEILVAESCPEALAIAEQAVADTEATVVADDAFLEECRTALSAATIAHESAKQASDDAMQSYTAVMDSYRAYQDKARVLRLDAFSLRTKANYDKTPVADLDAQIEGLAKDRATDEGRLETLQAADATESSERIVTQAETLAEEIEALEGQLKLKASHGVLSEELKRAKDKAEGERVNWKVALQVVDAIKAIRERLMDEVVEPLKSRMDSFLRAAGLDRPVYCRLANENGVAIFQLGWQEDGREVAMPAMGGGKRAFYCCALAYALTDMADPPVKLLMLDEMAAVDQSSIPGLLDAFVAVAETGMQVLAATHIDPQTDRQDVSVIECGAVAALVE